MIDIVLPILIALTAPTAVPASRPLVEEEETSEICLSFALLWAGTLDETSKIATDPVPDSYRQNYGWTGCQHLMKGALIDWHLAFGDESSASKALQFLSETALEGMPSIQKFEHELPAILKTAQKNGEQSASMEKLRGLVEAHERFMFLASEYLRAADFFQSNALLEQGARFLAPASLGLNLLYNGDRVAKADDSPMWNVEGLFTGNINTIRDLQMRYAIARAQMSRSAADQKAAGDLVGQNVDRVVTDAADALMDRGRDYCDSSSASAALKDACQNENDLSGRLRAVWRGAAIVELLSGGTVSPAPKTPFGSFEIAMKAIDAAAVPYGEPYIVRYDDTTDDQVKLFLVRAEDEYHRSGIPSSDETQAQALRSNALNDLIYAERLTPPVLNPNRFLQIADFYLRIYDTAQWLKSPTGPEKTRQAAYLRGVSARLRMPVGSISPTSRLN